MLFTEEDRKASGFTLVEVLIIAPIVILAIGGFISLITLLTGDVLKTAATNKMAYEAQSALDTFEQDTRLALDFVSTSYVPLAAQGSNNITSGSAAPTAFSGGSSLKMRSMTTTTNPLSSGQKLVYIKDSPHSCTSNNVTQNTPFTVDIVYYTTVTSTNPQKYSLWRRVVFPSTYSAANLCGAAWQQPTCAPVVYATGSYPATCKGEDQEILKDVNTFSWTGYVSPEDTLSTSITNASTVELNLGVLRTVAGNDLNYSGKLRATEVNSSMYTISGSAEGPAGAAPALTDAWEDGFFAGISWNGLSGEVYQVKITCPASSPIIFLTDSPPANMYSGYYGFYYQLNASKPVPCALNTAAIEVRRYVGGQYSPPLIISPGSF